MRKQKRNVALSDLIYKDGGLYFRNIRTGELYRRGTLKKESGYRRIYVGPKVYYEHRIIWEMHNGPIPDGMQVDHINGVRDDNRIENLQLLTLVENGVRKTVGYGESPYRGRKGKVN